MTNIKINKLSTPAGLINSMLAGAKKDQVDLHRVFQKAGLSYTKYLEKFTENPNYRIELQYISPLLRSLWSEMSDEASGFLSKPFKIGVFSMMCHAIITSGNLRRALLRSAKFISLLSDEIELSLEEAGEEARLIIHYDNPHNLEEVFFVTSLFVIWIRLSCWLIEKPMLLHRIEFTFDKPDYSDEFSQMFPCRHEFAQSSNMVVFDRKNLSLPLRQNEESLSPFLLNAPESLLTQFRSDDSLTAQVKRLLLASKDGELISDKQTFSQISDMLHLTTHTLRRRLKEEGHSFQEIKDSVRRDQAISLLKNSQLSLVELSEMLGFSEAAAFNRAFKKWTGQTPGSFRQLS